MVGKEARAVMESLQEVLKDYALSTYNMKPNRVVIEVKPENVREAFTKLVSVYGAEGLYLATIVGTDFPDKNLIRVDYFVNVFSVNTYVVLRTYIPRDDPRIPSLLDIVPGALAGELETYDLLGVVFEGNPYLRRSFFVPNDISEKGIYPLRKDSGV